jgi:hypothetical protein
MPSCVAPAGVAVSPEQPSQASEPGSNRGKDGRGSVAREGTAGWPEMSVSTGFTAGLRLQALYGQFPSFEEEFEPRRHLIFDLDRVPGRRRPGRSSAALPSPLRLAGVPVVSQSPSGCAKCLFTRMLTPHPVFGVTAVALQLDPAETYLRVRSGTAGRATARSGLCSMVGGLRASVPRGVGCAWL